MVKIQHKGVKFKQYKQLWYLVIKLSIVLGAGFFIYKQITANNQLQSKAVLDSITQALFHDWWLLPVLLGMTLFNWLFEIYKWKELVNSVLPISFFQALTQSLSSHTLALITPFKAGEYGGKALYYEKSLRKKVIFLNFAGNLAQLIVTLSIGIIGVVFIFNHFEIEIHPYKIRRLGYVIVFLLLAFFVAKNIFHSREKKPVFKFFKNIPKTSKFKIFLLAGLRYLLFSHQFYFLLVFFSIEVPYLTAMMLIFSIYFIATMLPVFSLFDFVIKGSIGIYLFSFLQVDEITIMIISTLLWLLNYVLPALMGSYFVLVFKPNSYLYLSKQKNNGT